MGFSLYRKHLVTLSHLGICAKWVLKCSKDNLKLNHLSAKGIIEGWFQASSMFDIIKGQVDTFNKEKILKGTFAEFR